MESNKLLKTEKMEPKSLRSGNIVKYSAENDNNDIEHYICKIGGSDIHQMEGNKEYADSHTPIDLTEDRLHQLTNYEAEKLDEGQFSYDRFKFIWKPEYNYWYVLDNVTLNYVTKVQWVHEFQNMYYVLNGQELESIDIDSI